MDFITDSCTSVRQRQPGFVKRVVDVKYQLEKNPVKRPTNQTNSVNVYNHSSLLFVLRRPLLTTEFLHLTQPLVLDE